MCHEYQQSKRAVRNCTGELASCKRPVPDPTSLLREKAFRTSPSETDKDGLPVVSYRPWLCEGRGYFPCGQLRGRPKTRWLARSPRLAQSIGLEPFH